MEPKNGGLEDVFPFHMGDSMLVFRGVKRYKLILCLLASQLATRHQCQNAIMPDVASAHTLLFIWIIDGCVDS